MDVLDLPYKLTIEKRAGYLYARVEAETITREIALCYLSEIADKYKQSGYRCLMLERDVPVTMPDTDQFYTIQDFLKMLGPVRIAIVNPHITNQRALEFVTTVAKNRGALLELHTTVAAAEKWLLRLLFMWLGAEFLPQTFQAACLI